MFQLLVKNFILPCMHSCLASQPSLPQVISPYRSSELFGSLGSARKKSISEQTKETVSSSAYFFLRISMKDPFSSSPGVTHAVKFFDYLIENNLNSLIITKVYFFFNFHTCFKSRQCSYLTQGKNYRCLSANIL